MNTSWRRLAPALLLLALGMAACQAGWLPPGEGGSPLVWWDRWWRFFVEIVVFFGLFLVLFRFMQGTRGESMLKGIVTVTLIGFFLLLTVARELELKRLELVLESVFGTTVLVFVIIFQPELRRGLLRLGQNPFVKLFIKSDVNPVEEVIQAALRLSKNKVGALIAFERETGLGTYKEGGVKLDAELSSELLETIFFPGSALHDGAVIIHDQRIAAAGCLFPLTDNPSISKKLGTRHRAAIGVTEESDAVTLVVSEETGRISVGVRGEIHLGLDAEQLEATLRKLILRGEESEEAKAEAAAARVGSSDAHKAAGNKEARR